MFHTFFVRFVPSLCSLWSESFAAKKTPRHKDDKAPPQCAADKISKKITYFKKSLSTLTLTFRILIGGPAYL